MSTAPLLTAPHSPRDDADRLILSFLCHNARFSPDPSTQNAACIYDPVRKEVLRPTVATNCFPLGVDFSKQERWGRPEKYFRVVHAETNAISSAAYWGIETKGKWLYAAWAACGPCAGIIINAGITKVVTLAPQEGVTHARWDDTIRIAYEMFEEAGVELVFVEGPVTEEQFNLRRNGQPFHP